MEKGPNMALVFSLSTLMFLLITGMETSKSLSQGPELKHVIQEDFGKDAVLQCSVNFNGISPGNVNIEKVVWWRLDQNGLHKGGPVFIYNLSNQQSSNPRMPLSPKYQLSMPPANEKDKVVSLLVKETQPEDEGLYRCVVNTNSGNTNCNFMLNVTVLQYETSTENAANQQEIPKNSYMSVAAVCVVVGSLAIGLLLLKLFQARRLRQGGTAKGTLCGEPSAPLRRCQQPLLFPKNNETDEVITSINVPLGVEECQQANNDCPEEPEEKEQKEEAPQPSAPSGVAANAAAPSGRRNPPGGMSSLILG
ncbi:uncharacterized protein LOC109876076 isoform X2 [Oncorhynchus kisutch]|uniref:uncharacterized protein LOC109876076 isoform X2 n=1 Tax=Oncorhynchus kisutch TaxID=8019 RepID=UPI0012DC4100|nr:uncharacterized protein LOC109876076 isoform X2 [Oncorhynchus kisutch]